MKGMIGPYVLVTPAELETRSTAFDDLCTKYLELRDTGGTPFFWEEFRRFARDYDDAVDMFQDLSAKYLELRAAYDEDILSDAREVLCNRNDALRADNKALSADNDRLCNRNDVLRAEVASLKEHYDVLDVKLNAFREENSRLGAQLAELQKYDPDLTVHDLIVAYEDAGHRNAEWLDMKHERDALKDKLDDNVRLLENTIKELRAEHTDDVREYEKECNELGCKINELQVENAALRAALETARAEPCPGYFKLCDELKALRAENLGLREQIAYGGPLHAKCDETITSLGEQRDRLQRLLKHSDEKLAGVDPQQVKQKYLAVLSALVAFHNYLPASVRGTGE